MKKQKGRRREPILAQRFCLLPFHSSTAFIFPHTHTRSHFHRPTTASSTGPLASAVLRICFTSSAASGLIAASDCPTGQR